MTNEQSNDDPNSQSTVWKERASLLQRLHQGPDVLVLPNPWDRLSARILASLPGSKALASTSAGVAAALGYPDGERAPLDAMLAIARQIVEAVDIPVTIDFEGGYAATPTELAGTVRRVVEVGAVGINLEDSIGDGMAGELRDPSEQAERLDAAREALQIDGVRGVLNARVDVLLQRNSPTEGYMPEVIRRCQLYREHGADCVYVPGMPTRNQSPAEARRDIELLVREAGCPVNLLASTTLLPISVLRECGVRRVSTGSGPFRLAYAAARQAVASLLEDGDSQVMALANSLTHPEVNRTLA